MNSCKCVLQSAPWGVLFGPHCCGWEHQDKDAKGRVELALRMRTLGVDGPQVGVLPCYPYFLHDPKVNLSPSFSPSSTRRFENALSCSGPSVQYLVQTLRKWFAQYSTVEGWNEASTSPLQSASNRFLRRRVMFRRSTQPADHVCISIANTTLKTTKCPNAKFKSLIFYCFLNSEPIVFECELSWKGVTGRTQFQNHWGSEKRLRRRISLDRLPQNFFTRGVEY